MFSAPFLKDLSGYGVRTETEISAFFFFPEAEKLQFSSVGSFLLFCLFADGNKVHFEEHREDAFHVC